MDRTNEAWGAATKRLKVMFDEMRNEQIKQQGNAFFYAMDAEAEIVSACAKIVLEEAESHNLSNEEELLEAAAAYDTLHMTWRDCTGYTEGQQAECCEEWYAGWVEYNEVFHYRMSTCDQN